MIGINLRIALAQKPLLLDRIPRALKAEAIDMLLTDGSIERCPDPRCNGLSAYAWGDVDEAHDIEPIGAASCASWQCGHCRNHWMERTSVYNSECFTHAAPDDEGEG